MTVRVVLGILVLVLAVIVMGPMIMMASMNLFEGMEGAPPSWIPVLFFAVPGAVLIVIGVLIVGRRYWADAVGWTLIAGALYGLLVLFMMHSFTATPDFAQMFESMDPQNPNLFKPGSLSVSRALALGLPMLAMGGVFAARRFRDKLRLRDSGGVEEMRERPVLQGTGVPVGGRPVSVTVISWILIATAVIGLLAWILMAFGPGKRQLENITRIWGMSVGVQILFGLAGNTIMLVCGFFLLRGRNWARWTIVVFFAIGFLLSIWFYGSVALLLPGLIWIAAFVFFLFVRTPAARYFGARARERAR